MNRNRIRKAQAKKLTAAALAVLMSTQLCAAPITAQAAGSADSDKDKDNTESQKEESKAVGKDETVYVKTDASGNTKDITVSDWLKNTDGTSSIQDASDLTDITNVKGDETYAQEDNGDMLWTSDGSDIYYQGKSNGQLPVDVKITYYLDGQEIAPENLAGKSGKVKIRFDYTNNSKKTVKVNGKEEEIYTPFLMASAMILPGDNFKNVEVSNGKVISDGSNNIVVGIALPGLEDSLKLDELDLGDRDEIPDYVEVTADATDFKLEMTATVASCGNLDDLGFSDVDSLDDLKDALDELADASQKLVDGSGDLLDGVKELKDGWSDFRDGVNKLDDGAGDLKDGASNLKDGVDAYTSGADTLGTNVQAYVTGAKNLVNGVNDYTTGASDLESGIKTFIGSINEKLGTVGGVAGQLKTEGTEKMLTDAAELPDGSAKVAGGVTQLNADLNKLHESAVKIAQAAGGKGTTQTPGTQVDLSGARQAASDASAANDSAVTQLQSIQASLSAVQDQLNGLTVTDEEGNEIQVADGQAASISEQIASISGAIDSIQAASGSTDSAVSQMDAAEDAANAAAQAQQEAGTASLADQLDALADGIGAAAKATSETSALGAGSTSVAKGVSDLYAGIGALDSNISAFQSTLAAMTGEGSELAKGEAELLKGASDLTANNAALTAGGKDLSDKGDLLSAGSVQLSGTSGKLKKGASDLSDGAGKLKDGTKELRDAGGDLTDGIDELEDGAQELADGMKEFDEDGIQKLTGKESDLENVMDRLDALRDADREYQTFTKLAEGMKGKVSFFIESDPVKNED